MKRIFLLLLQGFVLGVGCEAPPPVTISVPNAAVAVGAGAGTSPVRRVLVKLRAPDGSVEVLEFTELRKLLWKESGALEIEAVQLTKDEAAPVRKIFRLESVIELEITE